MDIETFRIIANIIGIDRDCTVFWDDQAITARLQYENGTWFICQNDHSGSSPDDRLGFSYGWQVTSSDDLSAITELIAHQDKKVSPRSLQKEVNNKFLASLGKYQNRELENIDNMILEYKQSIDNHKKEITLKLNYIKDYQLKKATYKMVKPDLNLLLKQLNNHTMVNEAYISEYGNLIVLTDNLISIDPTYNKVTHHELGRFTIRLQLSDSLRINVMNRDYEANGYAHPNIDNSSICWGNNKKDIADLTSQGDLYLLVDFIIRFFSTFPHQSDNPYINYEDWMDERNSTSNSSYMEPKI